MPRRPENRPPAQRPRPPLELSLSEALAHPEEIPLEYRWEIAHKALAAGQITGYQAMCFAALGRFIGSDWDDDYDALSAAQMRALDRLENVD